ncbi:hypothetical protein M6B38_140885 [Iris pallida]|uniref:Uncharacterized protein n=1 Tax=Iris pallida TaxID=29817 RepID=A0AAX6FDD6_IRIPA|nr:hypothetical protein M6B38_140885 [Iris pallida]
MRSCYRRIGSDNSSSPTAGRRSISGFDFSDEFENARAIEQDRSNS